MAAPAAPKQSTGECAEWCAGQHTGQSVERGDERADGQANERRNGITLSLFRCPMVSKWLQTSP